MSQANAARKGALIAIEGGEGSGKTTQARMALSALNQAGKPAIMAREPGATALGNLPRDYLKGPAPIHLKAETLLFTAARAQSMEETVTSALGKGLHVIADRHAASTVAYQGYGMRAPLDFIHTANDYATGGLRPNLYILLDLDPETGLSRTSQPRLPLETSPAGRRARQDAANERRYESKTLAFHRRVREGYLKMAKGQPDWLVVDAAQHASAVHAEIMEAILHITNQTHDTGISA